MTFTEHLRDALLSIRSSVLRSLLAMLGIIIGTASLIAMLSVGAGAQAHIAAQIGSLGAHVLVVVPAAQRGAAEGRSRPVTLTRRDAAAIAKAVPEVLATAPALQGEARLVNGNRNWSTRINGTTADYFLIRDWPVTSGRAFSRNEEAGAGSVVLLGATVAERLFGTDDPVGREVRLFDRPMRVIGVLSRKGESGTGRDQDDIVFMPFSTAGKRLGVAVPGVAPGAATYILIKARSASLLDRASEAVTTLLRQRHHALPDVPPGFHVTDPAAAVAVQRGSARTVGWLLAAIASISLLVGGIGIMNIMLVSVSERTREIGVRMALGARQRDVTRLFLVEALLICLAGGVLGLGAGVAASAALTHFAGWPTLLAADSLVAAVAFSAVVAVAFGYYPARKAARMLPATALRHER